jgi:hypothetical protein
MGLFTKDIKTMNDLFVHQLQDIYYAEKQLVKALPKMAEKATEKQLKQNACSASRGGVPDARRRSEGGQLPGDRRHHPGSR